MYKKEMHLLIDFIILYTYSTNINTFVKCVDQWNMTLILNVHSGDPGIAALCADRISKLIYIVIVKTKLTIINVV